MPGRRRKNEVCAVRCGNKEGQLVVVLKRHVGIEQDQQLVQDLRHRCAAVLVRPLRPAGRTRRQDDRQKLRLYDRMTP